MRVSPMSRVLTHLSTYFISTYSLILKSKRKKLIAFINKEYSGLQQTCINICCCAYLPIQAYFCTHVYMYTYYKFVYAMYVSMYVCRKIVDHRRSSCLLNVATLHFKIFAKECVDVARGVSLIRCAFIPEGTVQLVSNEPHTVRNNWKSCFLVELLHL